MKYITNDECHSVLSTVGSMDKVKKHIRNVPQDVLEAQYVFFENGHYHQLKKPLVPGTVGIIQVFLTVEYKDGSASNTSYGYFYKLCI